MSHNTSNYEEGPFMTTKVQRWGNSLGVRIPKRLAKKYGVVHGSQVQITDDGHRIILQPVEDEFTLEELLAQCEGENPHKEFFAEPMGREEL